MRLKREEKYNLQTSDQVATAVANTRVEIQSALVQRSAFSGTESKEGASICVDIVPLPLIAAIVPALGGDRCDQEEEERNEEFEEMHFGDLLLVRVLMREV